jgi:exopolysaccharide biosynthesis WecB/TagA/CpsF family protein
MASKTAIAGIKINVTSSLEVHELVYKTIESRGKLYMAFANTNLLNWANWRPDVAACLELFHVINDGIGVYIANLLTHCWRFPENLNGTDLIPRLLMNLERDVGLYMLGADSETVRMAASRLNRLPHVEVCGYWDGYSCWDNMTQVVQSINDARPEIVLVALGNPQQELWIAEFGPQLKANVIIGVGALFDYISGRKKRAPACYRRLKLEWLYRLFYEPSRLWRRYSVELVSFMFFVMRATIPRSALSAPLHLLGSVTSKRASVAFAEEGDRPRHGPL